MFEDYENFNPVQYLKSLIRDIPDYPKPGIVFKDITPLLADPKGFQIAADALVHRYTGEKIDVVVGIESRGFIFGAQLAARLNCGFVPARKPGKLPGAVHKVSYKLEYGEAELEMHQGSITKEANVVIVDDLLATGGSAIAAQRLVQAHDAEVHSFAFVVELSLGGREELKAPVTSVLKY